MTTATGGSVAFTCVWCGEQVILLVTDTGDELTDAHAFLAQHAACLHRVEVPRQRGESIVLPH